MKKRPVIIYIVGWYLLVTNILALFALPLLVLAPTEEVEKLLEGLGWEYYSSTIVIVVLGILCGVLILRGRNLGRVIYLIITPLSIIINSLYERFESTISKSIDIVFIILIFLPQCRHYFTSEKILKSGDAEETKDSLSDIKKKTKGKILSKLIRVASVVLFAFSVLIFSLLFTLIPGMIKSGQSPALIVVTVLLILFSDIGILIVPSIYLWGIKEWKRLATIGFSIAGGLHLFQGVQNMSTLSHFSGLSGEISEMVGNWEKIVFQDISLGLVYISIGVILGFISKKIKNKQSNS